jgi:glycine/D-amino acid oxidase-like deaminating enzyme
VTSKRNIIVIGGGIIGASIAWHLVQSGARVTLVTGRRGGIATPNSFAWINANWGNPEPYFKLRRAAMDGWKQLASAIPGIRPVWNGSICYDLPPEKLAQFATEHGAWGYGITRINHEEIRVLEPHIAAPPEWALKIDEEGMIEPVTAALALIDDASRHGARVIDDLDVLRLTVTGHRVTGIVTQDGVIAADEVVVAAGAATVSLAESVGIRVPVTASPGLLIDTKPALPVIHHIIVAPEMEMRQAADGRIVAATSFNGTEPGQDPEATARRLFDDLASRLSADAGLTYESYRIGFRPMPEDGFPIVGRAESLDGLYLGVTHSGITLAPAIGRFASGELLTGEPEPLLAPYRLSRFG